MKSGVSTIQRDCFVQYLWDKTVDYQYVEQNESLVPVQVKSNAVVRTVQYCISYRNNGRWS